MTPDTMLWGAGLAALVAATILTGLVRRWLVKKAIYDQPNERSSHTVPTPRGGGLAIVPAMMLPLAIVAFLPNSPVSFATAGLLLVSGLGMATLSWMDDRHNLSARIRLLGQAVCIVLAMLALPGERLVFSGFLPFWADHLVTFFAWLWFVNLYNFMDGIDGITGVESLSIGGALGLFAVWGLIAPDIGLVGMLVGGAAIGFLFWNWAPAKIFMGDIGSTTLGLWIGWMLMALACSGDFAAAAILPLYYAFDATWRLLRRALKREKIWQAHRSHFYQQASRALKSHAKVSLLIFVLNMMLVLLALAAIADALPGELALACGLVLTIGLCNIFHRQAKFLGQTGNGQ